MTDAYIFSLFYLQVSFYAHRIYILHILFQILCATLIATVIIPELVHARPRERRESVSGLPKLHEFCPGWPKSTPSSDPQVKARFLCHGVIETVCKKESVTCMSAITDHGYKKCEVNEWRRMNIEVNGETKLVQHTLSCRCAI